MPVKYPQEELPNNLARPLSGASDLWDVAQASAVLRDDWFSSGPTTYTQNFTASFAPTATDSILVKKNLVAAAMSWAGALSFGSTTFFKTFTAWFAPSIASSSDPYFPMVTALLANESGANGSASAVDKSLRKSTVTVSGTLVWSNSSPPAGVSTYLLSTNLGDVASIPNSKEVQLEGRDFTIEFFYKEGASNSVIVSKNTNAVNGRAWYIHYNVTTKAFTFFADDGTGVYNIANGVPIGTGLGGANWAYVAIKREGDTWTTWLGTGAAGTPTTLGTSFTDSRSINSETTPLCIFGDGSTGYGRGGVAGFRLTKGIARDASVVPSLPFTSAEPTGFIKATFKRMAAALVSVGVPCETFTAADGTLLQTLDTRWNELVTGDTRVKNNQARIFVGSNRYVTRQTWLLNGQPDLQFSQAILIGEASPAAGVERSLVVQCNSTREGYKMKIGPAGCSCWRNGAYVGETGAGANPPVTNDLTVNTLWKIALEDGGGGSVNIVLYKNGIQVQSFNDPTPLTGGYPGFAVYPNGDQPNVDPVGFDNWTDGYSFSTGGGGFTKKTLKAISAAAAWAGSVATSFIGGGGGTFTQNFTAAMSWAGTVQKTTTHRMSAALSWVGALPKLVQSRLSAALSWSGALARPHAAVLAFTAAMSWSGALTRRTSKQLAAGFQPAGLLTRGLAKLLTASASWSGALAKRTTHGMTASASWSGALATLASKTVNFTAAMSWAGSIQKQAAHRMTASASWAGAMSKTVQTRFTAAAQWAGALTGTFISGAGNLFVQNFTAAMSWSGAMQRKTFKLHTAAASWAGSLARRASIGLSAAFQPGGVLSKRISRLFAASLGFSGALANTRSYFRSFAAAMGFQSSLARQTNKQIGGSFAPAGSFGKRISKSFTAGLSWIGDFVSRVLRPYTPSEHRTRKVAAENRVRAIWSEVRTRAAFAALRVRSVAVEIRQRSVAAENRTRKVKP